MSNRQFLDPGHGTHWRIYIGCRMRLSLDVPARFCVAEG